MKAFVELDQHCKASVFVIHDDRGKELGRGEVPTSAEAYAALRERFALRILTVVALESGTMAFER